MVKRPAARRGEVARLDLYSVDRRRKTVTVRQGKGKKTG